MASDEEKSRPDDGAQPRRPEETGLKEFSDPAREWRRLFAECWGTFLLVLVAAGGHVAGELGQWSVSKGFVEMAPGLVVMAAIYSLGSLSGAHINPAVTLAFALRGNFPWTRVPGYIIVQILGGALAAFFICSATGAPPEPGATQPHAGLGAWQTFAIEVVLTTGLVSVVLSTAAGARNIGKLGAMAVGGYIAAAGIWAGPLTGASMNPARSLGPDIVRGDFSTTLIYVGGPLLGALLASGIEWILKGKPTQQGTKQAQGEDGFSQK